MTCRWCSATNSRLKSARLAENTGSQFADAATKTKIQVRMFSTAKLPSLKVSDEFHAMISDAGSTRTPEELPPLERRLTQQWPQSSYRPADMACFLPTTGSQVSMLPHSQMRRDPNCSGLNQPALLAVINAHIATITSAAVAVNATIWLKSNCASRVKTIFETTVETIITIGKRIARRMMTFGRPIRPSDMKVPATIQGPNRVPTK